MEAENCAILSHKKCETEKSQNTILDQKNDWR